MFAGSLPRDVADEFYAEAIHELARRHVPVGARHRGRAAAARRRGRAVPRLAEPARRPRRWSARSSTTTRTSARARPDRRARRRATCSSRPTRAALRCCARSARRAASARSRRGSSRCRRSARATCCWPAFVAARHAGRSAEESLRAAVAAGAAATLDVGAGRFDPRQAGRLQAGVEVSSSSRRDASTPAAHPGGPVTFSDGRRKTRLRARSERAAGEVREGRADLRRRPARSGRVDACCRTTSRPRPG